MLAGEPPSIAHVHEIRPRGNQGSLAGVNGAPPHEEPLDDWLGDISDEDWSEDATRRAERRRATSAYEELPFPQTTSGAATPPSGPRRSDRSPPPRPTARPSNGGGSSPGSCWSWRSHSPPRSRWSSCVAEVAEVRRRRRLSASPPSRRPHRRRPVRPRRQPLLDDDADDHAIDARRRHLHPPRGHEAPAR